MAWSGFKKNKPQIAESLGESIQTQLLSPDILLEYINENALLEKGIDRLTWWMDSSLQNPKVREAITRRAVVFLREQGPELLETMFDFAENGLVQLAENPEMLERAWLEVCQHLVTYLEKPENRVTAAEFIKRMLLKELPELAQLLNEALEEYLRRKRHVGSIGLGVKK